MKEEGGEVREEEAEQPLFPTVLILRSLNVVWPYVEGVEILSRQETHCRMAGCPDPGWSRAINHLLLRNGGSVVCRVPNSMVGKKMCEVASSILTTLRGHAPFTFVVWQSNKERVGIRIGDECRVFEVWKRTAQYRGFTGGGSTLWTQSATIDMCTNALLISPIPLELAEFTVPKSLEDLYGTGGLWEGVYIVPEKRFPD